MVQINLIFLIIFLVIQIDCIDPDYTLDKRIIHLNQAILNTLSESDGRQRSIGSKERLVSIWCKNRSQSTLQQVYIADKNIRQKIDFSLPIAFLVHGWFDSVNRTWVHNIMNQYVKKINSNVCGVDWTTLALIEYSIAANNTKIVAKYLGKFINTLQENGLRLDDVTIIGHSFGAQIAGQTGTIFNGTIGTIYGLDPAGWLFTKPRIIKSEHRLDKSDAKFVQCLHTDINLIGLGSEIDCGHQDFYPNDGISPQPGCEDPAAESGMTYFSLTCSHFKSVEYFLYSLNQQNEFRGWSCEALSTSYSDTTKCSPKNSDTFGIYAKRRIRGKLHLNTSVYPPYAIPSAAHNLVKRRRKIITIKF